MYLEFLLLITDYFRTLSFRIVLYEIIVPMLVSLAIFFLLFFGENLIGFSDFNQSVLTLLGVLSGFSITIITILNTSNSNNIEEIKKRMTVYQIGNKKISLFVLLIINFTYSVVVELLLIIVCLFYPFLIANVDMNFNFKLGCFSLLCGVVVHILLLTIRNLTDFYFILLRK